MKKLLTTAVATVLVAAGSVANAAELRIGHINTLTGPQSLPGIENMRGFMLGLESVGWKKNGDTVGGLPTSVFIEDDQGKPDVGLNAARKLIQQDKVDMVTGIIWSNVLMAVQRDVFRNKRILITTNAGAAPMSGRRCNALFLQTSFNNDMFTESLGILVNQQGIKNVVALAPNYQAGKDLIAGFKRTFKGKVSGQILFKLGQKDFQAEITRLRAMQPEAVFIFAPGGMGIAFMKQWAASGLGKKAKLYTAASVDWLGLPAMGDAAVGSFHTIFWPSDSKDPVNQEFVKAYMAKYKKHPSMYAAAAYDAPRIIDGAVKAMNGKIDDKRALSKALRHTPFKSVRGDLSFNVNGSPIESWYRREVVLGDDGKPTLVTKGIVVKDMKDSYWQKCPKKQRL